MNLKQQTKVHAALAYIYSEGLDAQSVIDAAQRLTHAGHDERRAYEQAINQFAQQHPEAGGVIAGVLRTVEASDPATIARYADALETYLTTDDMTKLDAAMETFAEDSLALAVQHGEMTAEQAQGAALEIAQTMQEDGLPLSEGTTAALAQRAAGEPVGASEATHASAADEQGHTASGVASNHAPGASGGYLTREQARAAASGMSGAAVA